MAYIISDELLRMNMESLRGLLELKQKECDEQNKELQKLQILVMKEHIDRELMLSKLNECTICDREEGGKNKTEMTEDEFEKLLTKARNRAKKDLNTMNYSTSNFAYGVFDRRGGKLTIEKANVELFIPPGAISSTQQEIYIYIDPKARFSKADQAKHRQGKKQEQTRVAPIILCGPPYFAGNTTFKVRAFNPHDKEAVIKYHSENKEERRDDVLIIIRVQNTGEDVKVNLKEIKEGWLSEYELEMTLKYEELWYEKNDDGSDPPAGCRFRLKNTDSDNHDSVYCRMKVKQNGNIEEKYLEMDTERIPDENQMVPLPAPANLDFNLQMSRQIAGTQHEFYKKLPEKVCHRLMTNLDIEREGKNGPLDWRALADGMGIKADTIEKMRICTKDHTLKLLKLLDKKYKTAEEFCNTLYDIFRNAELLREAEWVSPYTSGVVTL